MGAGLEGVITSDIWAPLRALTRSSTTHAPQLAAVTGLVVGVLSMRTRLAAGILQHTKACWTLVVMQVEPLNDTERMLALAENMLTATASSVVRR